MCLLCEKLEDWISDMLVRNRSTVSCRYWLSLSPFFLCLLLSFVTAAVNAADFGISVSEPNVTVQQNLFSSPQKLIIHRDDFDGPIEVDIDVKGGGREVQAYVQDDKSLKGSNQKRKEIDLHINTDRYVENGTYEVTVTATGTINGQRRTRVATFTITIQREEDNFEIAAAPQTVTVPQGSATSTNIIVSERGGFSEPVYLEIGSGWGETLEGFSFGFSGNAGGYAAANRSDLFANSEHWIVKPDGNGKSSSTLTITTYPDTPPGEYTFYVYGRRDTQVTVDRLVSGTRETKPYQMDKIYTRRAVFNVVVTADPAFIELIEPVDFEIHPGVAEMVTPPRENFYLNQIYISAPRSLHTIKTVVQLDTKVEGITVSMMYNKNIDGVKIHYLRVTVDDKAKPGTYYATVTATSTGTNKQTLSKNTRIAIIVPDKTKKEETKVSLNDDPKPVKVNCVGSSCPSEPITAFCLGVNCQSLIDLNCSGSTCTESLDLICLDGACPSSLDLDCDVSGCDAGGVNFFCGEGGCSSSSGSGFVSDLRAVSPSTLAVNCSGQGCSDDIDIIGLCYGDTCPSSINLNCPGTGCANTVEINCLWDSCSQDFNQICFGEYCSPQLQFNCDGSGCDVLDNFPAGRPYLTGAAPSGSSIFMDGFESGDVSSWSSGSSETGSTSDNKLEEVVTPRGSSEVIPSSNSDLTAIRAAANVIAANAGACLDAECPKIDCATAGILLQGLINAEANLDEMYKWLIQASDDAMAHLLSLNADGILTGEMLAQAQDAQALHQYLHNIGSLLLDLAALGESFKGVREGSLNDAGKLKQLDSAYETLKDLESAVSTIGSAYDVNVPTPTSNVPGAAIGALGGDAIADSVGAPNATPENIGSAVNDMKSQINDAIDAIKEAKEGRTPVAAIGKMIGRILKTVSAAKMKEREALIDEYVRNIGAGAGAIASSMAFLQKVNNRRFAAEDALRAIREAKDALMACMTKACGAMSLTRPNVSSNFDGWGKALQHFNAMTQSLFAGISGTFSVEDHCPGTETGISLFIGDGFTGSGSSVSLGQDSTLTPTHTVEAACPQCQDIADKIAINLTENDYWNAERAAIEEKLRQAETLRQRLEILETRKANNRKTIQRLNKAISDAKAFGFNWGPNLSIMLREAEARGGDLQRQITEMTREIERLEANKDRLKTIRERLSTLREARRRLREDLRYCEEEYCKDYDKDNEAVGRFIGEIFGVEVIDVKHVSGNNPYDRNDPSAENSGSNNSGSNATEATVKVINNIPIARLTLAGADVGCPNPNGSHYHGGANNCNGIFTADPAPGGCGQGRVINVQTIAVSSCPDL